MAEMNPVSRFFVNLSSSRRSARFANWILKETSIPSTARCLEVGCGNGHLAVRILEEFRPAQYVATDFDPRQVEGARRTVEKRYSNHPPSGLTLRTADMLDLPEPPSSFDVVLAFVAIHHASPTHQDFSRIPQALSEFDRVLRPGGRLIYGEILHKDAIRKWLTDHGFTIERIQRRWRVESVVARKPNAPVEVVSAPPVPIPRSASSNRQ